MRRRRRRIQPPLWARSAAGDAPPPSEAEPVRRAPVREAHAVEPPAQAALPPANAPTVAHVPPPLVPRPRRPAVRRSPPGRRRRASPGRVLARGAAFLTVAGMAALLVRAFLGILPGMPLFLVDEVRVAGTTYLTPTDVRTAAGLDDDTNLWEPKAEWLEDLESHPLVESAEVRRRLPSTLVFHVTEARPVALLGAPVVEPVDRRGVRLPVDPTRPVLDLPVIRVLNSDPATAPLGVSLLAREAAHLNEVAPEVLAVVSEILLRDGLVTLLLGDSGPMIRYRPPISERRLRDGIVAMNDALERFPDRPPREVDLRFEDQVVVRPENARASRSSASALPSSARAAPPLAPATPGGAP